MANSLTKGESIRLARLARDRAWRRGDLSYLMAKRPFMKRNLYDRIHKFKEDRPGDPGPFVTVACRRTAKSTTWAIYLFERCLEKPYTNCLFLAPLQDQVSKIVRPILHWIMRDAPADIRIKPRRDQIFIHNPAWGDARALSTFNYFGIDAKRGDKIRGLPSSTVIICDEVREADPYIFEYTVDSVLMPTFAGADRPLLGMSSSVPDDLDHPFVQRFVPDAQRAGRYVILPRSINTDWTKADDEATGYHNLPVEVRDREFECKFIPSDKHAIIPEFTGLADEVVVEHDRPEHFTPRTSIDGGFFPDPMAALFYYVDFIKGLLVVEDELILERPTTTEFAVALLEKEMAVFGKKQGDRVTMPARPIMRIADLKAGALEDLRRDQSLLEMLRVKYGRQEGIYVSAVATGNDRGVALRQLRANFGRCRINPRCQQLIYQLRTGTLTPKGDFIRSKRLGHCDLIACLRSAVKKVQWDENPYPATGPDRSLFTSPSYRPAAPASAITHNQTITHHDFMTRRA